MPPTPGFSGANFELFFDLCSDAIAFEVFWSQSGPEDVLSRAQDAPRRVQDPLRPPKTPQNRGQDGPQDLEILPSNMKAQKSCFFTQNSKILAMIF